MELTWEDQLRGLQQLEQEYHRAQQARGPLLSTTEHAQILQLSSDLPALWSAAQTTDTDRKQILQQLIEQVSLNVEGDGEWVELRVRWAGGQQTYSRIRRPVAGTSQLSQWSELKDRLRTLKSSGLSSRQIADTLHAEGFKPAKSARITAEVVRVWLSRYGLSIRQPVRWETVANEWTIPQLVDRYQLPVSTIYGWIRHGRVVARQIAGSRSRWILQSTPEQLDELINQRRKSSS